MGCFKKLWSSAYVYDIMYPKIILQTRYAFWGEFMKELFIIDLKDYGENDNSVFRRPSARAVIIKNSKIALVYSKKKNYYKFPGGGIKANEDMKTALIREVREEVGLVVIPDSIMEFGSVIRRQKSNYLPDTVFEQENFYFFCDTEDRAVGQELDDYEKEAEFSLKFTDIDHAIDTNDAYHSEDRFNEIMIKREKRVLQMVREYLQDNT